MEATAQVMGFLIASLDPALVLIATLAFPTSSLKMKQYTSEYVESTKAQVPKLKQLEETADCLETPQWSI